MGNYNLLVRVLLLTVLCIYAGAQAARAFELTPSPTKAERLIAKTAYGIKFRLLFPIVDFATHQFSDQVHEGLTQMAYECPLGSLGACADANLDIAGFGVIVGVRWNDDPPFQFLPGQGRYSGCPAETNPPRTVSFALTVDCWLKHFRDVSRKADENPDSYTTGTGTLLARTHFGDLQFLHSMAATKGVSAQETRDKILMWSEFMWRVQSTNEDRIAQSTMMGKVPVLGLQAHFPAKEERTIEDLFTVGRPWMRLHMRDIAFGSFLHMVQDSFAGGHVTRRARVDTSCWVPEIVEFHTYVGQDRDSHKSRDSLAAASVRIAPIPRATTLLEVMRELVSRRIALEPWSAVRPYLADCVFRIAADAGRSTTTVGE
jgi:hypothetical protein